MTLRRIFTLILLETFPSLRALVDANAVPFFGGPVAKEHRLRIGGLDKLCSRSLLRNQLFGGTSVMVLW